MTKGWYIKELSCLANVSIRALHYYDKIGLLKPSIRLENGYRRYSKEDLIKLQQIIALKYLGFELEKIKLLISAKADVLTHLRYQEAFLGEKIALLTKAKNSLSAVLKKGDTEKNMSLENIINTIEAFKMVKTNEVGFSKGFFLAEMEKIDPKLSADEIDQIFSKIKKSSITESGESIFAGHPGSPEFKLSMKKYKDFLSEYFWGQMSPEEYNVCMAKVSALIEKALIFLDKEEFSKETETWAKEWAALNENSSKEQVDKFADVLALYKKTLASGTLDDFLAQNKRPLIPEAVEEWLGKAIMHHVYPNQVADSVKSGIKGAYPDISDEEIEKKAKDVNSLTSDYKYLYANVEEMQNFVAEYAWSVSVSKDDYANRFKSINVLIAKISKHLNHNPNSEEGKALAKEWIEWQSNSLDKDPWKTEMDAMMAYKKALKDGAVAEFLAPHKRPAISKEVQDWIARAIRCLD